MKQIRSLAGPKEVLEEFLNLLFPPLCLLCERVLVRTEVYLCTHCQARLPHLHLHEERSRLLFRKLSATLPIDEVLAYLLYQKSGSTQKLLQLLKYRNYPELAELLGHHFGARLAEKGYCGRFDLIAPVPLHETKLRKRGYNQSELFAKGLSEALGVPMAPALLRRIKVSETQTRKSRLDRWLNVSNIFEVPKPELAVGKRVLLVDDVVTTGATLEACAEVLFVAGCKDLSVGAIAVA